MDRLLISSGWTIMAATLMSAAVATEPRPTHPCAALQDAAERLACYDKIFGRPYEVDEALPATDAKATQDFGFSEAEKRARGPDPERRDSSDQIEAVVAGVGYESTGEMIVTLDNGQVWLQAESVTHARLRVGDRVTIRKAAMGSYQLLTPRRIALRVRRTR